MANIKDWIAKQFFGFTENELAITIGNLAQANMFQWLGKDTQVSVGDNFNYIVKGYLDSAYAYEAITMIANKIRSSPPLVYEVRSQNKLMKYNNLIKAGDTASLMKADLMKSEAIVEVDIPRIRDLINRPNANQNWDQFINLISVILLATGNSLVYGVSGDARTKKLSEMWALPFSPLDYSIISGGIFEPVKSYRVNTSIGNTKMDFEADNIAHFKTVNPLFNIDGSQLYGVSPLHAYKYKLLRSKIGDEATNKILSNGFKMGLVTPKHREDTWSEDQAKGMKQSFIKALSGTQAYQRIVANPVALDYTPIGLDSTELGVLELDKADRESVYRAYQINPLLASTDKSSYNNLKEVRKSFIYDAVAPYCELISDVLTEFICKPFEKVDGKKYIIKLDYMSLPEMSADMKEMVDWLKDAPISTDEFRHALGYTELGTDNSREVIMSKNKITLSQLVDGSALSSGNSAVNEQGAN